MRDATDTGQPVCSEDRRRIRPKHQHTQSTRADRPQRQPGGCRHALVRELMERHAQDEDGEDAERDRHRIGPQHVGSSERHQLRVGIGEMRRQQPAAGAGDLGGDDRQQPHRGHAVETVLMTREHQVGDQHPAGERHGDVDPPQHLRHADDTVAEPRDAEGEAAIDDRRKPHRNRADEHRHSIVPEDAPRLVPEHHPARTIEAGEQREERDVEEPQHLADRLQRRSDAGHLRQRECEDTGAHRRGEPVGRELADHFTRVIEPAEGLEAAENGVRVGSHATCSLMRSVSASAARVR